MGIKDFALALANQEFPIEFPGHWIGGSRQFADKAPVIKTAFNPSRNTKITEIRLDKNTIAQTLDSSFAARSRVLAPLAERLEILQRFRQTIGDYQQEAMLCMQVGVGKPRWEARSEIESSLMFLDRVLAEGDNLERALLAPLRLGHSSQDFTLLPVGVTLAFLPFSTPFTSFVQYFTATTLAGCPLWVMASSHAVLEAAYFGHILEILDLKPGTVNITVGNFTFFMQALQDPRIQAAIYRGSREHCEMIRKETRGASGRQLMLYSGGKNAAIVDESADLDLAVRSTVFGAFKSAGQLCTSTSRLYVHQDVFQNFKAKMVDALAEIKIGPTDSKDDDPFMGPLYSKKAVEKYLRFQTMAKREAAESWQWGKIFEADVDGYFVTPGVHYIEKFDNTKAYQSNVLMCPDVAVYRFEKLEEAITQANQTDAPLTVSYLGDDARLRPHMANIHPPNIICNLPTVELEMNLPVTGRLQCGHHRLSGIGLVFLLTYPQSLSRGDGLGAIFNAWPSSKS